jgi:1-acyl-sn-glycerol-3-phosphate acyltransferase
LVSLYVWISFGLILPLWCFLVGISRLCDRDPVRYRTGWLFRKLGRVATLINPLWGLRVQGDDSPTRGSPCVVVCNHQSLADIPFICNLPWEMKWMAKKELFRLPILGWMMRWSGDIPVDRENARSGVQALLKAKSVLARGCSVMIFPEGTRTPDGRVQQFEAGAFHLAMKARVPILPLAIEGSRACIPKHSWNFGTPSDVLLKVFPPIDTSSYSPQATSALRDVVRETIMGQIAAWRDVPIESVDGTAARSGSQGPDVETGIGTGANGRRPERPQDIV